MKNTEDLKKLNNIDLVEEFEKSVRFMHYDHKMEKPDFSVNEIREELLSRLSN